MEKRKVNHEITKEKMKERKYKAFTSFKHIV